MYALITLQDGTSESYNVTAETYQAMKADFRTDQIRRYEIAEEGIAVVDWSKVKSLKKSDKDPKSISLEVI